MERDRLLKSFDDELWRKLQANKGTTKGLNSLEYAAVCLMNFQAEVNNGGLHTYFYNSSGDFAVDTPEVMRRIGAPQAARILDEANRLFGEDGPASNRHERCAQLDALAEVKEERLELLTREFYDAEDGGLSLADLFDDYVVSQRY